MTKQFDVYPNPNPVTRRAFPYVAVLQADVAVTGVDRVAAPLAPRAATKPPAGRLVPVVSFGEGEFVLLVPGMTAISGRLLRDRVGSIARHRDAVTAALDYLFQGV